MRRFLARISSDPRRRLLSRPAPFVQGTLNIFFRGFIANADFLADESRRRGEPVSAVKTSQLLALAYQWWREDIPKYVLGEFALAVYDRADRSLLLTHDELGLVPLFYTVDDDECSFACYLEDLLQETGVGDLDDDYIADYLTRGIYFGARTPFAGIRRVGVGESVIWKDARLRTKRVGTLHDVDPLRFDSQEACDRRFADLVQEAVRSAIPEDGKVWCELSGGLDSSTVLSIAARAAPGRVEAVSFVYSDSELADEQKWIRAVLEEYPVPWHAIDIDRMRPFSEIPSQFVAEPGDRLFAQASSVFYENLVVRNGVAVVLTGQGGDAVLLGDRPGPYFLADLLKQGKFSRLTAELRALSSDSPAKRPMAFWWLHFACNPLIRHLRSQLVDEYFHRTPLPPWFSETFAARMHLLQRRRQSYVPRTASVDNSATLERILAVTESLSKHGHYNNNSHIEFRHPLLYRPLIEFMLSIPWEHKHRAASDRSLQRRAMAGIVPQKTLQRQDKGSPSQAFYEGLESSPGWQKLLTARPHMVERGYVDLERWREAVQQACLGRTVGFGAFAASVNLEAWLQRLEVFRETRGSSLRSEVGADPVVASVAHIQLGGIR
jgi:asparagine synthase (glutamine-hydrolysing)